LRLGHPRQPQALEGPHLLDGRGHAIHLGHGPLILRQLRRVHIVADARKLL